MVNITFIEVHLDDASFSASADRPFSSITGSDTSPDDEQTDDEQVDNESVDDEQTDDERGSVDSDPEIPTRGLAAVGALLALVGVVVAVKRLAGGEDPDVDIETAEDEENRPVGVTVDE